jgi:hypothetical protein
VVFTADMGSVSSLDVEQIAHLLREADAIVHQALDSLPMALAGADAAGATTLVIGFDRVKRAATAGWALAAHRGEETDAFEVAGHRSAPDWLGQISGVPFARASEALGLAENLAKCPEAQSAFLNGDLSLPQAQTIADTVAVDPSSGPALLETARQESHRELSRQAVRIRQTARSREDERQRRERAHRRRSLRHVHLPEGGVRVQVYLTEESWGKCLPALNQRADLLFRQGRKAKVHERRDQYLADAFVELVSGKGSGETRPGVQVQCIVRVDASVLRNGSVAGGEMCEIAGVGPVGADVAYDLLGESFVRLLVTDGADVTTITGTRRYIPARLEAALIERDRCCVVPECDIDVGLQIHHWRRDVRDLGPTTLDNLCRICTVHHDLATNSGWKLTGGPGQWGWVGPDWPVSRKLRSERRRLQAARRARGEPNARSARGAKEPRESGGPD